MSQFFSAGLRSAIPDSVVLLDDWADGNLTSNREDYNTTAFSGFGSTLVEQGDNGDLARPEWNVDNGSPSVTSNNLTAADGDRLRTPLGISNIDGYTWEFRIADLADGSTRYINLTSLSTLYRDGESNLQDGYFLFISGSDIGLAVDDGGSASGTLGSSITINPPVVVRVERDFSGGWEVFIDGDLQVSGTDTTFTTSDRVAVSAVSGSGSIDLSWFGVDDGS
jgi:hypothetical protein